MSTAVLGRGHRAPAVTLTGVGRVYAGGVRALDDVSLTVEHGTFVAVTGPPGSGTSTLMHCAAGLDAPTSGSVRVDGQEMSGLSESRRGELRRERVGFVFRTYELIPSLSAEENITLPLRLAGRDPDREWLATLVERVGLTGRLAARPAELTDAEQQRVAVVRALAGRPVVVFADEPTGALDPSSAHQVLDLLRTLVDDLGQTVVMVTHDPAAASRAHRALLMAGGKVVESVETPTAPGLASRLASLGGR
ncbi:ABC transporter ATP-binding protein [Streptomyces sp. DSM 41014]|uniref:ABC transporter ATP-binding protein n=1 Tax=Streptomyces hintoniae TaxID=3075521 RepID=A0ABU2UM87_9ACTN|nr:ABC transporter ATP-binding protein [Streptomyces sp. DSM 41014]MDT0474392.1 ABC transporter ATP-binding protein [Streptomyces sp. DSM 41014]